MKAKQLNILTKDQTGELAEVEKTKGQATGSDNRIIWRPDVPNPDTNPAAFKAWLKAWHEAHNDG